MASLTLGWLHVIALLGALQGVFLAAVLATKRSNRTANRLLAGTMLAFSVYLATTVYYAAGFERVVPHFFGVAYPLPFLFGPLVYLYAVSAADRSRRLSWRDSLHFVPVVAVVISGLPIYLMSGAEKIALYGELQRGAIPPMIAITDPLKFVSGVIYTVATILFLRRHRERVKDSYSSVERVNLRWLLWLGGGAATIWLLAVAFQLTESFGLVRIARGDDFISLGMAVLVYGIGYMGLRQPEVFRYETAEHRVPVELRAATAHPTAAETRAPVEVGKEPGVTEPGVTEPGVTEPGVTEPGVTEPEVAEPEVGEPEFGEPEVERRPSLELLPAEPATARYERSGLSEREAQRLRDALTTVMEKEQPWRDSDLTLADLADRLSTTPHKLSEVLNSEIGRSFYDFVNGYRVREVQRRIAAGEAKTVTILALALDAGFASKSTFNVVFKKHTNRTPSDYRQASGM